MVKLIITASVVLLQASASLAQEAPKPTKAETKTTPVMKIPANTNTPRTKTTPAGSTPAEGKAPALTSWDYYLTSAKATFYTGNDNKEKPSQVQMQMTFGTIHVCNYMVPTSEYKEFAVNSSTEIVLQSLFDKYHLYDAQKLGYAESNGVQFYIIYSPNFLLDAWKIEKVIFTLEFRDGTGKLHPTLGTKTIVFNNIGAVLNKGHDVLVCEADQFLMPRTTTVRSSQ